MPDPFTLTDDVLEVAYALFLNRKPDRAEVEGLLASHHSLEDVRRTFLYSQEFRQRYREMLQGVSPSAGKTIIHLHVPKTAGSSLNKLLIGSYHSAQRLALDSSRQMGIADDPNINLAAIRLIHGHLTYGFHELLPNPAVYLCLLRLPQARIISFFRYLKRKTDHPYHHLVADILRVLEKPNLSA